MKILLVDDEQELVSTVAERLSFRNIEAKFAINEKEVLKLISENDFDIAVLDMKMPGISGLELKRKIEKIKPDIKYIFLTGHGSEDDFKEALKETQVADYLIKPINIEKLIEKINKALN